jgi:DNA-binding response OmpR family regulator
MAASEMSSSTIILCCVILATPAHVMARRGQHFDLFEELMGGPVFVLFVDDAAFADAAARSLESAGMRTIVMMGSVAAMGVFDNAIDVVVTDRLATAESGLTLARMIKNKRPIILLNTFPELLEEKVGLRRAESCEPFDVAELCRSIRVRLAQ